VKCFFTPSDPGNPHRGILVTGAGAGGGPGPGGSFGPYEHYNTLAQTLPAEGIAVLQIVWRKFADLEAATQDMMACMRYAHSEGLGPMVTIGWSMGGAVAIEAAHRLSRGALRRSIRGVITIAGQSKGAGNIAALGARGIPLLILHGTGDTCIRSSCAERLFAQAQEPKELRLFEGEDHGVPSALALLQRWIPAALPALCRPGTAQSVEVPCIEAPGHVKCFFTPSDPGNPHRGILVTGAGAGGGPGPGGSFGPYEHYNTLAQTLPAEGIAVLQIVWRKFADLEAATQDMMACMRYAHSEGLGPMVTIGWSMGGAVAIEAAHRLSRGALRRSIRGVITIAGQSKGAGNIAALGARGIPLLILHGTGDTCIRSSCAERLFAQAQEPKELRLFEGEDHGVPSALALLQSWIPAALPAGPRRMPQTSTSSSLQPPARLHQQPHRVEQPELSASDMQIYVIFAGQLTPFTVARSVSVGALKLQLGEHFDVPAPRVQLIFNGAALQDSLGLSDSGVPAQGTLRMAKG